MINTKNSIFSHRVVRKRICSVLYIKENVLDYDSYCRDKVSDYPLIRTDLDGYVLVYVREKNCGRFSYDFDILE
jgi:hypothetical protein